MPDVLIAKLRFPNDPTGCIVAHQMFMAEIDSMYINIYSISKVLGKETRVFNSDGTTKCQYFLIDGTDQTNNNFRLPSFIDCSKKYKIKIDHCIDITLLQSRIIDPDLVKRIKEKITLNESNQKEYEIATSDFVLWNPKCAVST